MNFTKHMEAPPPACCPGLVHGISAALDCGVAQVSKYYLINIWTIITRFMNCLNSELIDLLTC